MEDTCCGSNCAFVKLFNAFGVEIDCSQCPNYVESVWVSSEGNQPKVVKDCSPKRTQLMVQEIYNAQFAVQKIQTEARNESKEVNDFLKQIKKLSEQRNIGIE